MSYDRDQYRTRQVLDYISMFSPELKKDFRDCSVLDVGCGEGVVSLSLAPYSKCVLGVDIHEANLELARREAERLGITNVRFRRLSAYDLRPIERYDVVILSDVLEHVRDQRLLLERCVEMMVPGGVMYLNTPNKWFPLEPHLRLPFLSYLPKGVANHYTKAFGKGSYENYHLLSYGQFRALLDSLPIRYVLKTQPNPQRRLYRIGNRLVANAPPLWCFANAFQVIIQRNC